MNLVYFSHSYRKEDAFFVKYFGSLLRDENLIPSLDPPSKSLNSAKLERHLQSCDGMIAVLSWREGGVSQYILYEISLCLRARKPLLVFVEDDLPDRQIPARILQSRFSRRFFLRQIREHRHAIHILKSYIGDRPPPKYQPSLGKKKCLLSGLDRLPEKTQSLVRNYVSGRGYSEIEFDSMDTPMFQGLSIYEKILSLDVALYFSDLKVVQAQYLTGLVHAAFIPSIKFTTNKSYPFHPDIPRECQPSVIDGTNLEQMNQFLEEQFELFEEDFIEIEDQNEIDTYSSLLVEASSEKGYYDEYTRKSFIKELVMGDKYTVGQAGAVGRQSHAHDMTFNQIWNQAGDDIDLDQLAAELSVLRSKLKTEASEPEHDSAVGEIASAEVAAKDGDGPTALQHLAKAGKWALDVAVKIGAPVAAAALKAALML